MIDASSSLTKELACASFCFQNKKEKLLSWVLMGVMCLATVRGSVGVGGSYGCGVQT